MPSTKYTLQITKKADKFLQSDDNLNRFKNSIKKLVDYLEDPETNSMPDIKKLKGRFKGTFRLRDGDFRILFRISNKSIFIIDILPRGQVYKKK